MCRNRRISRTFTHIHESAFTRTRKHKSTFTHTHISPHSHISLHSHISTHSHAHTHESTFTRTHTRVHIHTHTHKSPHPHTDSHATTRTCIVCGRAPLRHSALVWICVRFKDFSSSVIPEKLDSPSRKRVFKKFPKCLNK